MSHDSWIAALCSARWVSSQVFVARPLRRLLNRVIVYDDDDYVASRQFFPAPNLVRKGLRGCPWRNVINIDSRNQYDSLIGFFNMLYLLLDFPKPYWIGHKGARKSATVFLDAMEDSRGEDATRFLLVRRDDERTSHLPYVHMLVVENNTYKTNSQLIKEVHNCHIAS